MEEEKTEIEPYEDHDIDIQPTAPIEEESDEKVEIIRISKDRNEVVEDQRRILQAIKAEHEAKKAVVAEVKKDAPGASPGASPASSVNDTERELPPIVIDQGEQAVDLPQSSTKSHIESGAAISSSPSTQGRTNDAKIFGFSKRNVLIASIFLVTLIMIVIIMQITIFVLLANDSADENDSTSLDDDPISSSPTLIPIPSPSPPNIELRTPCISTVNEVECIANSDELFNVASRTQSGDVIVLCPNTILRTESAVRIVPHDITLCCGADKVSTPSPSCIVESRNANLILEIRGDNFTLQGITFQNGADYYISDQSSYGNVQIQAGGHHRILDCTFLNGTGCPASNVYVRDSESLVVERSHFLGGRGSCPSLYIRKVPYFSAYKSTFQNNTSTGLFAGNIDNYQTSRQTILLDETSFVNNTGQYGSYGGGFMASGLGNMPSLTIRNSLFRNNRASYGAAGAAFPYTDDLDLIFSNNTGERNIAYQDFADEEGCNGFLVFFDINERCFAVSEDFATALPLTSVPSMLLLSNWTVDYASEFYELSTRSLSGEMDFRRGQLQASLQWHLGSFQNWVEDRADNAIYTTFVSILERSVEAVVFQYESYSTALWQDEKGSGQTFEFRRDLNAHNTSDHFVFRDTEFVTLLESLRYVSSSEFFAAMPDSLVTQQDSAGVIRDMLQEVPLPGSFWDADFEMITRFSDWYQLGAYVTAPILCTLIDDWISAIENMDYEAEEYILRQIQSSRSWKVLEQMDQMGGWSEVVWGYADSAINNPSLLVEDKRHISGLGCSSDTSVITY